MEQALGPRRAISHAPTIAIISSRSLLSSEDPWAYETPYERTKYQQTLELIPNGKIGRALELACAEGRFTRLLAPRWERLIAADFSQVALQRAEAAASAANVQFQLSISLTTTSRASSTSSSAVRSYTTSAVWRRSPP